METSDSEIYGDLIEQIDDFLLDFSDEEDEFNACIPIAGLSDFERGYASSTRTGPGKTPIVEDDFSADLSIPADDIEHLNWLPDFFDEASFHESAAAFRDDISSKNEPAKFKMSSPVSVLEAHPGISNPGDVVPLEANGKRSMSASIPAAVDPENSGFRRTKKEKRDKSGEPRRCKHCGIEKTPQWRMGPLGPKSLCNACGVRYKSGRLFPEYRPAASPTFIATVHSNSHKKVMEMRLKSGKA